MGIPKITEKIRLSQPELESLKQQYEERNQVFIETDPFKIDLNNSQPSLSPKREAPIDIAKDNQTEAWLKLTLTEQTAEPKHKRLSKLQVKNPKQIENWLNQALEKYVTKDSRKTALMHMRIDRLSLSKVGISGDQTDQLYRSIYVTSVSFFQNLQ